VAEEPLSTALTHAEPTDARLEETRRAEHDLVRSIVIGIAVAVPICVALFMAAIGFDVSYESAALGGPLAMAAAVGTLAGLFFGSWAGFVFKSHTFDELDRKANLRKRPSPPPAGDD
jgi:amino acid transporter